VIKLSLSYKDSRFVNFKVKSMSYSKIPVEYAKYITDLVEEKSAKELQKILLQLNKSIFFTTLNLANYSKHESVDNKIEHLLNFQIKQCELMIDIATLNLIQLKDLVVKEYSKLISLSYSHRLLV
jgi:hypothetical protein